MQEGVKQLHLSHFYVVLETNSANTIVTATGPQVLGVIRIQGYIGCFRSFGPEIGSKKVFGIGVPTLKERSDAC